MFAVRPVNPPRPSSSSFRPSRSACRRLGVRPFRRCTNDSMGSPSTPTAKTKSDVSFTSGVESILEIDPDRQQIGAEGAHPEAVELWQRLQPFLRVVVGYQVRGAVVPAAAKPHPDTRVGLYVLDVLGLVAELGDEPELVADAAAAQRSAPRFS